MSDFVTCSTFFNIWSEGSIAQLLNIKSAPDTKSSKYVNQTLGLNMYTNYEQWYARVILYRVANVYIFVVGVPYLGFGTLWENEIQSTASSDTNKYNLRILSSLGGFVE